MAVTDEKDVDTAIFVSNHVLFRFESTGDPPTPAGWNELGKVLGILGDATFDPKEGAVVTPLADGSLLARFTLTSPNVERFVIVASSLLENSKFPLEVAKILNDLKLRLTAVIPNWLGGAAAEPSIKGGPGGAPQEILAFEKPSGNIDFAKGDPLDPDKNKLPLRASPVPVDVFILDTVPAPNQGTEKGLHTLISPADDTKFKKHPMGKLWTTPRRPLTGTSSEVTLENGAVVMTVTKADQAQLDALENGHIQGHKYSEMSDHGLFIAGLIRTIAPIARIHLIQVLNENGVGSFEMMAHGFEQVRILRTALGVEESPYLVNCSFTITLPRLEPGKTNSRNGDNVSAHSAEDLSPEFREWLKKWGEPLTRGLSHAAAHDALRQQEFSGVVAAAGNESAGRSKPYAARYPAALEQVLGVGALELPKVRADYSNYPDDPVWNGVMALGELKGLSTKSATGYVSWKGTSFATPLVTGRFADLISRYDVGFKQLVDILILPPLPPQSFHEIAAAQQ